MHEVKAKAILSSKNGMNIYRGCSHGCIYCDSRSLCYHMNHDFEDIEVKANACELLAAALKKKRRKCMIGTSAMSDPYMPLEETLGLTRRSLEIIYKYGFGAAILTKSARILRDLDILKKINERTKCVVQMTLTTYDESLCRIIEPNVSSTNERIEALKILRDNGIPTVVWLCPILPHINDTQENLIGLLNGCARADVHGILCFGFGLTLRDGDREYFYKKLDEHFPGMKERYISEFGNAYSLPSPNGNKLMNIFSQFCQKHKIIYKTDEVFKYLNEFEDKAEGGQLTLFD